MYWGSEMDFTAIAVPRAGEKHQDKRRRGANLQRCKSKNDPNRFPVDEIAKSKPQLDLKYCNASNINAHSPARGRHKPDSLYKIAADDEGWHPFCNQGNVERVQVLSSTLSNGCHKWMPQ